MKKTDSVPCPSLIISLCIFSIFKSQAAFNFSPIYGFICPMRVPHPIFVSRHPFFTVPGHPHRHIHIYIERDGVVLSLSTSAKSWRLNWSSSSPSPSLASSSELCNQCNECFCELRESWDWMDCTELGLDGGFLVPLEDRWLGRR